MQVKVVTLVIMVLLFVSAGALAGQAVCVNTGQSIGPILFSPATVNPESLINPSELLLEQRSFEARLGGASLMGDQNFDTQSQTITSVGKRSAARFAHFRASSGDAYNQQWSDQLGSGSGSNRTDTEIEWVEVTGATRVGKRCSFGVSMIANDHISSKSNYAYSSTQYYASKSEDNSNVGYISENVKSDFAFKLGGHYQSGPSWSFGLAYAHQQGHEDYVCNDVSNSPIGGIGALGHDGAQEKGALQSNDLSDSIHSTFRLNVVTFQAAYDLPNARIAGGWQLRHCSYKSPAWDEASQDADPFLQLMYLLGGIRLGTGFARNAQSYGATWSGRSVFVGAYYNQETPWNVGLRAKDHSYSVTAGWKF